MMTLRDLLDELTTYEDTEVMNYVIKVSPDLCDVLEDLELRVIIDERNRLATITHVPEELWCGDTDDDGDFNDDLDIDDYLDMGDDNTLCVEPYESDSLYNYGEIE